MGSFSILNNIPALAAQNHLNLNNITLSRTLLRLSSGKRINSGADDAAGLQIADSLRANTAALNQAVYNANAGIGVAQIADGALSEMGNLLNRAVTLAEEAATETIDSTGRASLQCEYDLIQAEIARIALQTNMNGTMLFTTDGINGSLNIFVGDICSCSSISVTIDIITASGSTVTSLGGQNLMAVDLTTAPAAAASLTTIKSALGAVSGSRANIGVGINRLQSAVAVMQFQSQNTQAAESTIRDANIAEEIVNLTKCQMLAQAGMAALAQANQNSQLILSLLRNG